jgi:hypothetical protein
MKKFAASVGLIAVGATALHAAETSALNSYQQTKAWSVQATLRGFYDDNVNAQQNNGVESAGFELSPSVDFGLIGEQTSFNVGYTFTARFFDKNPNPGRRSSKSDYTHRFEADLAHAFSPRLDVAVSESFVIGQEPDFLRDPAGTQRVDGDNIRNNAGIDFNLAVTELLGLSFGYQNSFYDYADKNPATLPAGGAPGSLVTDASNSGLLDRLEHSVRIDSNWRLTPKTTGIVGYTYSQINYIGDEVIKGIIGLPGSQVLSEDRDSRGHTFYVGAQHVFSPKLSALLKVGAQYFDYYNSLAGDSQWSPYVQSSLTYAFQTTTTFDAGFKYSRSAANVAGTGGTAASFVQDEETAVVYGSLKHQIIPKLTGSLNATAQHAKYNGGGVGFDGQTFIYYQLGLDLSYQFTRNLSGHIGYNFDKIDSDLANRSYDRNRVYLGVTAGF